MSKQHQVPFIFLICILSALYYHWSEISCHRLSLMVTLFTKKMKVAILCITLLACCQCYGQGHIGYKHISTSTLKDEWENEYGAGNMQVISGNYTFPLSEKRNQTGQLSLWSINLSGIYALLSNNGQASKLNPKDIFNGSLNLSYLCPLSGRWSLVASIGGGVYAPSYELSFKSILANGGVLFIYRFSDTFSGGIGAGVSNSYGVPMAMPMIYLSWRKTGRWGFKIDMASGLYMAVSMRLGKKIAMELAALEVDGMSAVVDVEGKSKIYSCAMLSSTLYVSFQVAKEVCLYGGFGGNWARMIKFTERSLKGFVDSFKEEHDGREYCPALRVSAGVRYGF